MKRIPSLLVSLAICLAAAGQTPDLRIHTSIYDTIGATNSFTLTLGAAIDHAGYVDVICSGGNQSEAEIVETYYDEENYALMGTNITCQVDSDGIVEVYCDEGVVFDYVSLTGAYVTSIEFKDPANIEILSLEHNELESLDLSAFNNLRALYLNDNPFSKSPLIVGPDKPGLNILEIAMVGDLDETFDIDCYPQLKSFDAMSTYSLKKLTPAACPGLLKISIDNTSVETLDVTHNPDLVILNISESRISSIDLTKCPNLQQFYATHTSMMNTDIKLTEIDLTQCPNLIYLFITGNLLTELDVTQNPYLIDIYAANNCLTSINLDNNPQLLNVFLQNNDMDFNTLPIPSETWGDYNLSQRPMKVPSSVLVDTPLDLASRVVRSDSPTVVNVYSSNENQPGLEFEVDGSAYTFADGRLTFNTVLPDSVFASFYNSTFPDMELRTQKFKIKDAASFGQPDRKVVIGSSLTSGKPVKMYVGIAGASAENPKTFFVDLGGGKTSEFTATTSALPSEPNVDTTKPSFGTMTIYLPEGEKLTAFKMADTKLNSIDLTEAPQLAELSLVNTKLSNIDLQWNRCLTRLELSGNNFADRLTLAGANGAYIKNVLSDIILPDNGMTEVTLNEPGSWRYIDLSGNSIQSLNFTDADNLEYLDVSHNQMASLKINYCAAMHTLLCSHNNLDSIFLPEEFNIRYMDISNNRFTIKNLPLSNGLGAADFIYAPQAPIQIPTKGPGYNLSDQIRDIDGLVTHFDWYDTSGRRLTEGTDYTITAGGATHFADSTIGSELYCVISHPVYPALSGDDALHTTAMLSAGMPTHLLGSFVTTRGGDTMRLSLASSIVNDALYIDWTGTESLEQYPITTDYTIFSAETTEDALVNVWSYDEADNLRVFSLGGTPLRDVDLSPMTNLIHLTVADASLSSIKMPQSPDLAELTMDGNNFSAFDFKAYPRLSNVSFIGNDFETLDLSGMDNLGLAFFSGNALESVVLDNPRLWSLALSDNKLTSIDLSGAPSLYQVSLDYNELSSIDLDGLNDLRVVYLNHNRFDFSNLPVPNDQWSLYTYGGQPEIAIKPGSRVDLSYLAERDGVATVYTWFYGYPEIDLSTGEITGEALIPDDEYTIANGITTFHTDLDQVSCVMTNELFPLTYLATNAVSVTAASVEQISIDEPSLHYNIENLTLDVSGMKAGARVRVFNVMGRTVAESRADACGRASVTLPCAGIYIVSTPGDTIKLTAR